MHRSLVVAVLFLAACAGPERSAPPAAAPQPRETGAGAGSSAATGLPELTATFVDVRGG